MIEKVVCVFWSLTIDVGPQQLRRQKILFWIFNPNDHGDSRPVQARIGACPASLEQRSVERSMGEARLKVRPATSLICTSWHKK